MKCLPSHILHVTSLNLRSCEDLYCPLLMSVKIHRFKNRILLKKLPIQG
ncbi:hypothetical protein Goari_018554 [Gossypium aridum]|uniref:Uncharacterized protein n=1 Tax=Gossypium aridum TaxID=34290 RepID=A0A7J8WQA9_GOSAI|nr:hypothetical protein [Gossypium aridum]